MVKAIQYGTPERMKIDNDCFFDVFCIFLLFQLDSWVFVLNLNLCWIWNNKNLSKIIYCERRKSGLWSPRVLNVNCECINFYIMYHSVCWLFMVYTVAIDVFFLLFFWYFSFSAIVLSAQVVEHNWQWKIYTEYWLHLPKMCMFNSPVRDVSPISTELLFRTSLFMMLNKC